MPAVLPATCHAAIALVGNRAVAEGLALAHVGVGRHHAAVDREQQRDRELRDRVGVATGRAQHRDAARRRRVDVDVGRVTSARPDRQQREVEHGPVHRIGLDHEEVGPLRFHPRRQLLCLHDADRLLVDPRVEDDLGDLFEGGASLAAERSGDQGTVLRHAGSIRKPPGRGTRGLSGGATIGRGIPTVRRVRSRTRVRMTTTVGSGFLPRSCRFFRDELSVDIHCR